MTKKTGQLAALSDDMAALGAEPEGRLADAQREIL